MLEAGFMRVRCEGCRAEYLLVLSCKTRYFCTSCHAKRLACWTQWLGEELLAPVAHRQMVFVLPKRLRPYFQWRRKLLGDLARIAARTATDFVERELLEPEVTESMLAWPHSGFSVHDGVWLDQDDAAAHERLARTCARCPVSLERLEYDAETGTVAYTSDKADGPTAGRHTFEVTDFMARLVAHIPDKGQVLQRTYGYFANRARGERRKAARAPEAEPVAAEIDAATSRGLEPALAEAATVEPAKFSRADARRWAELIRRIYEVDPLVCPKCGGTMRMIAQHLSGMRRPEHIDG